MSWIERVLGPSLTKPPLPLFLELYARRFRSVCRLVLRCLYKRVEVSLPSAPLSQLRAAPTVVLYANHPSFWDPLVLALLTERLWPSHPVLSAIDAEALRKHVYFRGLGFFGLRPESPSGLKRFLRFTSHLWSQPHPSCLVLTPEGRFTPGSSHNPASGRPPLALRRGLALALWRSRATPLILVPVALAYGSGLVRLALGEPFQWQEASVGTVNELHALLGARLESALDRLDVPARDPIDLLERGAL